MTEDLLQIAQANERVVASETEHTRGKSHERERRCPALGAQALARDLI